MIANTPEAWSDRAHRADPCEAVMWSRDGQQERFGVVLDALAPRVGESLLDYGCGTGALTEVLSPDVRYLGYDWSNGMVLRSRRDHERREFTSTRPERGELFDVVAAIGTFNLATYDETFGQLEALWDGNTRRALAACLYAGSDPVNTRFSHQRLGHFAERQAKAGRWRIEKHRPNDLLLVLWK